MLTTVGLILVIVVVALVLYAVPGMPVIFRRLLYAVVVIVFIVWLLGLFGLSVAVLK